MCSDLSLPLRVLPIVRSPLTNSNILRLSARRMQFQTDSGFPIVCCLLRSQTAAPIKTHYLLETLEIRVVSAADTGEFRNEKIPLPRREYFRRDGSVNSETDSSPRGSPAPRRRAIAALARAAAPQQSKKRRNVTRPRLTGSSRGGAAHKNQLKRPSSPSARDESIRNGRGGGTQWGPQKSRLTCAAP